MFVNAAETVRRQCLARTPLAAFVNSLTASIQEGAAPSLLARSLHGFANGHFPNKRMGASRIHSTPPLIQPIS